MNKFITRHGSPDPAFIEMALKSLGVTLPREEWPTHLQEDYWLCSEKYPVAIVADGVTLEFVDNTYPDPSGAAAVSKIFCEQALKVLEEKYEQFSQEDLVEAFRVGNSAVGDYNRAQGRTKDAINYMDHDLFAATAAGIVIKDEVIYWFSLCDSGVTMYDSQGKTVLATPNGWARMLEHRPKNWDELDRTTHKTITRQTYRNGVDDRGEPIGYGVVTGEVAAELYLLTGTIPVREVAQIAVYTDGYEPYTKNQKFMEAAALESESVDQLEKELVAQDPNTYGHERTLVTYKF